MFLAIAKPISFRKWNETGLTKPILKWLLRIIYYYYHVSHANRAKTVKLYKYKTGPYIKHLRHGFVA